MNNRKIAMGPGAASLILIVVTLSLCILAMLTLVSAQNDENLSLRSTRMITQVYELSARAEKRLAELDGIVLEARKAESEDFLSAVAERLPEDMTLDGDQIRWVEPLDNRMLECAVRVMPADAAERLVWTDHRLIVNEPEDDWEWN